MNMEKVRDGLWSWLFTAVDDFKHEVDVLGSIRLGVLESITDGLPGVTAHSQNYFSFAFSSPPSASHRTLLIYIIVFLYINCI